MYGVSSTSAALFLAVTAIIFIFFKHDKSQQKANNFLSYVIHCYLIRRYPIRTCSDGRPIPTCSYRWPNGQGDVAKFLEGEKNSRDWGRVYGRAYRIWSGMTPEVVVRDAADVEAVFKDSDKHSKAINNDAGWLMGELLGKCLGLINGTKYQKLRDITKHAFTHKSASTYLAQIERITKHHFDVISTEGGLQHGIIDPVADLRFLPFWIVADIIYGDQLSIRLKSELKDLIKLRESLWTRMIQGGATRHSWSQYLPTKTTRDLKDFKQRWARFNEEAYEESKSKGQAAIVQMYEGIESDSVEREQVLQTIDEMLFANLDVTMGGISWNLLFLAAHQDVQEQIRQEIRQTRDSSTAEYTWNSYLQSSSTLLAASILESSRLKPLAAFTVPQSAPTDRVVAGFLVPAGTNFIVDTHALNTRNPYWGPDGEAYRPSRFLNRKPAEMRYQFWRFGFGPRQCLGKFVVDLIIRVLMAHLVENYRLHPAGTTNWEKDPATWILHPNTKLRCEKIRADADS
ncbi:cytochrome P450 [Hypoxylon cercidicola]|nr:cytochrome P450 [Hypoxylon cercidicola]